MEKHLKRIREFLSTGDHFGSYCEEDKIIIYSTRMQDIHFDKLIHYCKLYGLFYHLEAEGNLVKLELSQVPF